MLEAMDRREKYKNSLEEADKFRHKIDRALKLLKRLPSDKKLEDIRRFTFEREEHYSSPKSELEHIFGSGEGTDHLTEMSIIGSKLYPKENDDMTIGAIIESLEKQRESLVSNGPINIKKRE